MSKTVAPSSLPEPALPTRRRHPVFLAITSIALCLWLAFLAWLAFRG